MNKKGKLKVGDWVKVDAFNRVVKVISINQNIVWFYLDNAKMFAVYDDCTKLPIKFKRFEIGAKDADKLKWGCCRTQIGVGDIHFVCMEEGVYYFTGFKVPNERFVTKHFLTIEQAKDWLELQYATMLAKARGLV